MPGFSGTLQVGQGRLRHLSSAAWSAPLAVRKTLDAPGFFIRGHSSAPERVAAADGGKEVQTDQGPESAEMVSVQFRGNEFQAPRGTLLRTALLRNGLSPHSERAVKINCRGAGTCGTCAVQIEGSVIPPQWGTKENIRLNLPPHKPPRNSTLRLACSVQLDGNVKVTKFDKFWGQGTVPLESTLVSDSVTPLGDLEFVFDSKKDK